MAINLNVNMPYQCLATAASSYFTAETCKKDSKVCPKPWYSNQKCPYYPVKFGDCEYDNQCLASEASSDFTYQRLAQLSAPQALRMKLVLTFSNQ